MGYRLANVVSVTWAHLPERQFKVLMRMALTALDTPSTKGQPAHVYFGGWEVMSLALARDVPDDDGTPEATRIRRNLCSEVTKITGALVAAGAIKPSENARRGHQQSFLLTLSTVQTVST